MHPEDHAGPDPAARPADARLHVVLVEPEIAANAGAIGRTCVAAGAMLWLVRPLGFHIDDRSLRRAGLDYWSAVHVCRHTTFADFETALTTARILCYTAASPLTCARTQE